MGEWLKRFRRQPEFDWIDAKTSDDFINRAERYFLGVRAVYDFRARWHRRFYRMSGVGIIVLGSALPLLVASNFRWKDWVISGIGLTVAMITALRGLYRWDAGWVLMRQTEYTLSMHYLKWKADHVAESDPEVRRGQAISLLEDLFAIREQEARDFFKELPIQAKESQPPTTGA